MVEHVKRFGRIDVLVNNAGRQDICEKLDEIDLGKSSIVHDPQT